MASKKLYEPSARYGQTSFSVEGRVYVWGGVSQDAVSGSKEDITKLASSIEQFDPYLEVWTHAGFVDLIRRCLSEEREERPSADEIITNIRDM